MNRRRQKEHLFHSDIKAFPLRTKVPYSIKPKRAQHRELCGEAKKEEQQSKKKKALSFLFGTDEDDVPKSKTEVNATPKKKRKAIHFFWGKSRK